MGDILTRRRELILAGDSPLPEWDYEWSYSSGKYPNQEGWTKTTNGTASVAFSSGYMTAQATDTGSYIQWDYPQEYSKAVMQVGFRLTTNKTGFINIFLGDGASSAIGVRANYASSKIRLYLINGTTTNDMTNLAEFAYAKTFQLKLIINNGVGEVWWRNATDGADLARVANNVDLTTIANSYWNPEYKTLFHVRANGSGTTKVNWYTAYMKFNRVS